MGFFKFLGDAVRESVKEGLGNQPCHKNCPFCNHFTSHAQYYKNGFHAYRCNRCGVAYTSDGRRLN